ncbi:MAG: DNA/RNA non-specific endonuclease [Bacteroidota bacterium]
MAKFRRNHQQSAKKSGTILRVGIFAAIASGLFYIFNLFTGGKFTDDTTNNPRTEVVDYNQQDDFLPTTIDGRIVHHKYYSLSYNEKHEQAEWVAYVLTEERLNRPWVDRPDYFNPDPKVRSTSAEWEDYKNSGYDRGHLVPAADMAFSEEAIKETFYMSNISPQSRNFNQGIWRELEELTRSWAKKYDELYVVSGPVFTQPIKGKIGKATKVSVPAAYFKVLLDIKDPEYKGIAFVLPNEVSYDPLYKFAMSIDEAEEVTGLNFFPDLMEPEYEKEIEANFNIDLWYFSKAKYDIRVNKWNKNANK